MKNLLFFRTTLVCAVFFSFATSSQAQSFVFDWADYSSPISNVQAGDSFTINNVDNSGVDFTFTFSQALDSRTSSSFETIVSPTNTASDFPTYYTGNGDLENLYNTNPLYIVGKTLWEDDQVIVDVTTSAPIIYNNFIIGDIDRLVTGNANSSEMINSYEDRLTISAFLDASAVGVNISTTGSTININNNVVESFSGGPLNSSLSDSQINVTTQSAVNSLRFVYQNGDASSPGLSDPGDGWSNSQWITFGTDAQLTRFEVVPEPSSALLAILGAAALASRRRR